MRKVRHDYFFLWTQSFEIIPINSLVQQQQQNQINPNVQNAMLSQGNQSQQQQSGMMTGKPTSTLFHGTETNGRDDFHAISFKFKFK